MLPQVVPPERHYFAFSIDVAATLELYCDGGDDSMLEKLDGLKDRMYAGYCLMVEGEVDEDNKYHVIDIRPVQQGFTKPHPRKSQHARPTMCIPILPETAHPRSREPLQLSRELPWENCYHPTCYDICTRVPTEWRDYSQSPCAMLSAPLVKAIPQDMRYGRLLRAGVDDDQALRILGGQQDAPDVDIPDDASETDSQICKTFLAKIPGFENPEEDGTFVPVLRVEHVLSNIPGISDPSQLYGDLELFQEIVQEYQLARYGSILFEPPEGPHIDDTSVSDNSSMVYSMMSGLSGTSTEDLESDPSDSHELDSLPSGSEELPTAPASRRKGKWKVKSLFRRVMTNIFELVKWRRFSSKS
ncbi:uncharacterized protein EV420DRAFT_1761013 [Desarmillaria tabescens]|uniref:Uncharacterized protein n=1 Tax=Armillaria tabescens TaxID=1929756 RepID=A0AA39NDS3_ARMTA|nr:uncharacterized protein EV420DRAFT_1761013 [Desarmillaria tabescens]KAK0463760.1 hypothetical protein EV420DRAFT_1761013 [Desarmillaria tabescens]